MDSERLRTNHWRRHLAELGLVLWVLSGVRLINAGTTQNNGRTLAGHWVIAGAKESSSEIPPFCRLECVIDHDEKRLTVKSPGGDQIDTFVLGGVPIKTTSESFGHRMDRTRTASWDGSSLRIETRISVDGSEPNITHLHVSIANEQLQFERTMSSPLNNEGRGRGSKPARFIYDRRK
jgi:hypothetical protein